MVQNATWLLLGLGTFLFVAFPHPFLGAILVLLLIALFMPGSPFTPFTQRRTNTAPPTSFNAANTCIQAGNDHYAAGNYTAALAAFSRALELDPNSAIAYCNRGASRAALNDEAAAIADYNQAIQLDPSFAQVYGERGIIYAMSGRHQEAIADCDRAIQLNPHYVRAYFGRGAARSYQGDFEGAIADFTAQLHLQPTAATYYNIGIIQCYLNRPAEAIATLTKAIELDAQFTAAYYQRGNAYNELDDLETAQLDLQKANWLESQDNIKLFQDDEHGYYARGLARQRLGDWEGAIADLQKAAQISQKHQNSPFHQKVMAVLSQVQPSSIV